MLQGFASCVFLAKDSASCQPRWLTQHLSEDGLQEILFLVFMLLAAILSIFTYIRKYSLIPVLGVLFCAYLLIEIRAVAWEWFFAWMGIGLSIYFLYGYKKSRLSGEKLS